MPGRRRRRPPPAVLKPSRTSLWPRPWMRASPTFSSSISTPITRACWQSSSAAKRACPSARSATACSSRQPRLPHSAQRQPVHRASPAQAHQVSPSRGDFAGQSMTSSAASRSTRTERRLRRSFRNGRRRQRRPACGQGSRRPHAGAGYRDGQVRRHAQGGHRRGSRRPGASARGHAFRGDPQLFRPQGSGRHIPSRRGRLPDRRHCQELRRRLGHDFSQYKRGTMLRRIRRRMQVVGATTTDEYLDRLRTSPE